MHRLLLITSFVLMLSGIADACDCAAPPPPKKSLDMAHAVFTGKCVEVVIKDQMLIATFEVDRVWKGDIGAKVVVNTSKSGASCGYPFTTKGDAAYIVYAYKDDKGALETHLCSRTNSLASAREDLKELGDGAKPKAEKKEEKK